MTQERIPGGVWINPPHAFGAGTPAMVAFSMTVAASKVAFIFSGPTTSQFNIEFLLGTVTQAPSAGLRCSVQGVDANGDPDGVEQGFRVLTAGLTSNAWLTPNVTSDGTDTGIPVDCSRAGDPVAFVVAFESWNVGDSLNVAGVGTNANAGVYNLPYIDSYTASWTKQTTAVPAMAFKNVDNGLYYHVLGCLPWKAINTPSYNVNSSPDERGLRFIIPSDLRLTGGVVRADADAHMDVLLYNELLAQMDIFTIETQLRNSTGIVYHTFHMLQEPLIEGNKIHRLTFRPDDTTNCRLVDFDVNSNDALDSMPGGKEWFYTERTDGGDWTDTLTKCPVVSLWFSSVDRDLGGAVPGYLGGW